MKIKYIKDLIYGPEIYGKTGSLMSTEEFLFDEKGNVENYSFLLDGYGRSQERIRFVEIKPNVNKIYEKALNLVKNPSEDVIINHLKDHVEVKEVGTY
ncbi:hypothetical protein CLPU_1c02530 [Gottschalkia purinilytica]|uniref:Uncharacterized protein n=1 Tax=Gottschalkia purinilytica TaxID=1503 RepID=A0A0L0WF29_GOTPU|nr:hypothetical protein [Gottschalkia purinilytica]KNF10088.1 hypothetical protein CLPU_1c02530 [Gottschalkia purinilytica]